MIVAEYLTENRKVAWRYFRHPLASHPTGVPLEFRHLAKSAIGIFLEMTDFIAFVVALTFLFAIFSPKIACQAPKRPKPLHHNNIRVAF
jgi:hypothetical protein